MLQAKVPSWRWNVAQWAEQLWWRRYLSSKNLEEYHVWKQNYWRKFLLENDLEVSKESIILDAGSGPAGIFMIFDQNKVKAYDPLLGEYQDKELINYKKFPWVEFHEKSLEQIEGIAVYDCIFCINVINHVNDIVQVLENFFKILKPGGKLVITSDVHHAKWLQSIFAIVPGDILHPHQLEQGKMEQFIQASGFCIIENKVLKRGRIFEYQYFLAEKKNEL